VRVKACGVCGSDLHAAGSRTLKMPAGTIMGHEFAGGVEEVGAGVSGFARGDAIASMAFVPCGECPMCAAGAGVRCFAPRPIGFGDIPGAFAEFVKTRPGAIFKMPDRMSFRTGATVEPLVAGLHGLRRARFQAGETCLITGAGSLGLATLLWARFAGARAVVVSEVHMARRDLALKLGADAAVDPRMHSPLVAMTRLTGAAPDVIFECIGAPGTLAQAIGFAPRGGRVVVLGAALEDDGFPPATALGRELDILFSLGVEPGEVETTIAALASGRISTQAMITRITTLDELPQAFAALGDSGPPGKLMLEF
jgi:(R,R)-butanediol dehydrogenase/meso-butanediol dehydrogenase/diacetyl reductase